MPRERARPGLGDPPGLGVCGGSRAAVRRGRARCLGGGEQVPGAGQQLAGDRDGGDLLPAPFRDGGVAGGEFRGALGGLGCLVEYPAQPGRALLICAPPAGVNQRDGSGRCRSWAGLCLAPAAAWFWMGRPGSRAGRRPVAQRRAAPLSRAVPSGTMRRRGPGNGSHATVLLSRAGWSGWPRGWSAQAYLGARQRRAAGDMMVIGCLQARVRLLNLGWLSGPCAHGSGRQQGFGSQPQVIS
jgi:hypothetical protein